MRNSKDADDHTSVNVATTNALIEYQEKMGVTLSCVVTGGGAQLLLPKLSSSEFGHAVYHEPDWVLKGLTIFSGSPIEGVLANSSGGAL